MRHVACLAFALGCAISSVQAADLPVYTPVAPVPVFTWTGFYVGLNAGYGWAHSSATATITNNFFGTFVGTGTDDFNGGIAGGQVGVNYQTGAAVLGVEVDAQWSGQKKRPPQAADFFAALMKPLRSMRLEQLD